MLKFLMACGPNTLMTLLMILPVALLSTDDCYL